MRANESKVQQITGIVLFVFSLLMLVVVIPMQIKDVTTQGVSPRFLPQLASFLIMAMSIPLYIGGVRMKNKEGQKEYEITMDELKLVGITIAAVVAAIILYTFIGFIPASIIVLAFLQYRYGQRKLWKIATVSIGVPVVIQLFFYYILMISLPMGVFFY